MRCKRCCRQTRPAPAAACGGCRRLRSGVSGGLRLWLGIHWCQRPAAGCRLPAQVPKCMLLAVCAVLTYAREAGALRLELRQGIRCCARCAPARTCRRQPHRHAAQQQRRQRHSTRVWVSMPRHAGLWPPCAGHARSSSHYLRVLAASPRAPKLIKRPSRASRAGFSSIRS